jgi:hypothetical protein
MAQPSLKNAPLLTEEELQGRLGEFQTAVAEFNDGYYFESHETLEDLWMVTPLPDRDFFQAVIQLAAAFVHFVRGEYPGTLKLLAAAAGKLRAFSPEHLGVDVAALLGETDRAHAEIAALGPDRFTEWDESRVPHIELRPEAPPRGTGRGTDTEGE